jgi:hypothetical protein
MIQLQEETFVVGFFSRVHVGEVDPKLVFFFQ